MAAATRESSARLAPWLLVAGCRALAVRERFARGTPARMRRADVLRLARLVVRVEALAVLRTLLAAFLDLLRGCGFDFAGCLATC
jgi:hypothetical protein